MVLDTSNSSNLEQLVLKGLIASVVWVIVSAVVAYIQLIF